MLAYTYISPGKFELIDKPKPELQSPRDAIVHITLGMGVYLLECDCDGCSALR